MYDNQVQSTHSIQQLTVEVTGSTIYPTEFIYTYKTNHTALEAKVQVCLKSINQKIGIDFIFPLSSRVTAKMRFRSMSCKKTQPKKNQRSLLKLVT